MTSWVPFADGRWLGWQLREGRAIAVLVGDRVRISDVEGRPAEISRSELHELAELLADRGGGSPKTAPRTAAGFPPTASL